MLFTFPNDHHLVLVTENSVQTWNAAGTSPIFTSSSSGILAAKTAADGSDILAVADSQVVLLHDLDKGMNRSYRLKGTEGKIRLLEYSSDGRTLYFTTTLQNAIQIYSLNQSQLLAPLCSHPSPPTVLAVSPNNHLIISASKAPSVIYLQNIRMGTQPHLIHPKASTAAVIAANFHPERSNVFMLGFQDGTVAAYDATRITKDKRIGARSTVAGKTLAKLNQDGEIGCLNGLHTVTTRSGVDDNGVAIPFARSTNITSLAFVPGYRTRAVTVGTDGRCRIIDFEQGGKILRTWHVRGPATCLSILAPKAVLSAPIKGTRMTAEDRSASKKEIIAVGRQDGKILLFDFLGLQLAEQVIDRHGGRIIDLEWKIGPGTKDAVNPIQTPLLDESRTTSSPLRCRRNEHSPEHAKSIKQIIRPDVILPPPVLLPHSGKLEVEESIIVEEYGTVNHSPLHALARKDLPSAQTATNYMDLFSPVRPPAIAPSPKKSSPDKGISPRRTRARLASDTFLGNSDASCPMSPKLRLNSSPRHKANASTDTIYPLSVASIDTAQDALFGRESPDHPPVMTAFASGQKKTTSLYRQYTTSHVQMPGAYPVSQTTLISVASRGSSSSPPSSGRILADLRRVGGDSNGSRRRSGLGILAPYITAKSSRPRSTRKSLPRAPKDRQPSTVDKHSDSTAPEEDLWLSDVSEPPATARSNTRRKRTTPRTRKQLSPQKQPQPSKTDRMESSNSPVKHGAHVSTDEISPNHSSDLSFSPAKIPPRHRSREAIVVPSSPPRQASRSAEKENLSPGSAQSPRGPVRVRDYFPRKSSLKVGEGDAANPGSPRKRVKGVLREVDGNGSGSPLRSAAKAGGKKGADGARDERSIWLDDNEERTSGCRCGGVCCGELRAQLDLMRREIELLRRDVKMLRNA